MASELFAFRSLREFGVIPNHCLLLVRLTDASTNVKPVPENELFMYAICASICDCGMVPVVPL